ncbi:DUF3558 family protein [Nocardia yamanashiensis]|uniref:DUF3558 family protein n=1 Tax=Nocardia yamanashiensis TaxID=209247 RepID=UPI0009FE14F4|nr:DUF3558 family protein [Nocardia yamanashiensis]
MTNTVRTLLVTAVAVSVASACGTTSSPESPTVTSTSASPYVRAALANPCDSIPPAVLAQQQIQSEPTTLYPDKDSSLPDSSSNGCSMQFLTPGQPQHFDLGVTNRDFAWVEHVYQQNTKTGSPNPELVLDGKKAIVNEQSPDWCLIAVEIPGGTLKMDGRFTTDPSVKNCDRALDLARTFLPYLAVTSR